MSAARLEAWGRRLNLEPLDLWFLGLRVAVLVAGVGWWTRAHDWPGAPGPAVLVAFLVFSVGLYVVNALRPRRIAVLYRIAALFDLGVVFFLVRMTGRFESELHLAFILLVALHAYYFGVHTGLGMAAVAAVVYAVAVEWPPPVPGFVLRVAFFGLVGLCLGMVGKQANRRQRELERQQEQLLHSDRLATVGELAAGLAHELRNPLAGISGALHVLDSQLGAVDGHHVLLDDLQAQIGRMNKTLTDLLQHARPATPQRIAVDVNALLEQSLRFLPHSGIEVTRHYDASLPSLSLDPNLLHQALLNILVNARQAMPQGGRIVVETRIGADAERPIEVRITDTGTGIERANLDRIFAPFFTTKIQGTGLGLAIAARIVEQHGGRIAVASTAGVGSTFTISLPLTPMAEPCRSERHALQSAGR